MGVVAVVLKRTMTTEPEAQAAMVKPQEDAFAMTTEDQMLLDSFFESPKEADGELSDMAC